MERREEINDKTKFFINKIIGEQRIIISNTAKSNEIMTNKNHNFARTVMILLFNVKLKINPTKNYI